MIIMKKCAPSLLFVFVMFLSTAYPAANSSSFSSSSATEPLLSRKIIQLFHDYGADVFATSDHPVVARFIEHFKKIKSFITDHNAKFDWCKRFNIPITVRILSDEHAHNTKIVRIVKIDNETFVTLACGGGAKIWKGDPRINDWHWVADLVSPYGHRSTIQSVAVLNSRTIVMGDYDGCVKIWHQDSGTGQWEKDSELIGHNRKIIGIAVLDENTMATGSEDDTVRIWKRVLGLSAWQTMDTLSNMNRLASIAALDKNTFITGYKDNGVIRMWSRRDAQSSWRNSGVMWCGSDCSIESLERLDDKNFVAASYTTKFYWKKNGNEREWHFSKTSTKRDEFIGRSGMRDSICSWIPFDENTLIVGYTSGIPRVWQFPPAQEIALRIGLRGMSDAAMQTIYDELMDLR